MTLKIRNEETGEVIEIESPAYKGIPDGGDFDFSSIEGILTPFDKLEGTLLEASRRTMCAATEQFMLREYQKKKKSTPERLG